jgi:hypothetical protein
MLAVSYLSTPMVGHGNRNYIDRRSLPSVALDE